MTTFAVPVRLLLTFVLLTAAGAAHGKVDATHGFLHYHTELTETPKAYGGSYILPNEETPIEGQDVYGALGPGVLLSVGSERGPIALTMAPKVTHLLQLDRDPAVVIYNRVNILLLRAAARSPGPLSEQMKRYMRWKLTPTELASSLTDMKLTESEKLQLKNVTGSSWWAQVTQEIAAHPFHSREDVRTRHDGPLQFVGVKYWRDEKLAARIFKMAQDGRMQAELVDLTDEFTLQMVRDELLKKGLQISGIDTSNVWFFEGGKLRNLIRTFADLRDNLFIFTWLLGPRGQHHRLYTGMSFSALERSGFMKTGDIQPAYQSVVPLIKNGIIKSCDERLMSR